MWLSVPTSRAMEGGGLTRTSSEAGDHQVFRVLEGVQTIARILVEQSFPLASQPIVVALPPKSMHVSVRRDVLRWLRQCQWLAVMDKADRILATHR